jgi:hypothetical protein
MEALLIDIGALAMFLTYVAIAYWHAVRTTGSTLELGGGGRPDPTSPFCGIAYGEHKGALSGQVGGHLRLTSGDPPLGQGVRSGLERSAYNRQSYGGGQENVPAQRDAQYRGAARRREDDAWQRIVALRWEGGCLWR